MTGDLSRSRFSKDGARGSTPRRTTPEMMFVTFDATQMDGCDRGYGLYKDQKGRMPETISIDRVSFLIL